ncbi:MAG TPA: GxxExxY protein [Allosphingosinicella sp.]|jgi:iron complex transport system substrate-binding protein|nr:GxxExxY protein [Allosphingosinicella sp.]
MKEIDAITADVLDVALRLHRELGPGLLESVYETLLARRLQALGYRVLTQQLIGAEFDDVRFDAAFRADLIVDDRLLIEVKSVERVMPVHSKQLLTYLRLMKQPVGLLINFGNETLKEGFRRIVNDYRPSAPSLSSPRLRVNQITE